MPSRGFGTPAEGRGVAYEGCRKDGKREGQRNPMGCRWGVCRRLDEQHESGLGEHRHPNGAVDTGECRSGKRSGVYRGIRWANKEAAAHHPKKGKRGKWVHKKEAEKILSEMGFDEVRPGTSQKPKRMPKP